LNIVKSTINQSPKSLFPIDAFGALLSAFMLGVVLVKFENVFGIPKQSLYILALIPCLFAAFDMYSYYIAKRSTSRNLKIIASLNLLYCGLSLGYAFYHANTITNLGWLYVIGEIIIILILVRVEWNAAAAITEDHLTTS